MPNVLSKTSKQLPQKFNFHAFNFQTQIFPNGFYTCFGKRGSGKTTFMMHASQHMPFSNTAQHIVIGGSEKIRALWATIVHPIFIHEPSIAFLKLLIEEAQRRIKYCEENRYEFPKEWEIIVWLDDCGVYSEFMHCQEMRWLCSNGRNSGFTVFLLVQKLTQAHKECREGNDGVFALFTLYQENVKMIWKENASGIKFPLFQSIYAGGTRRRGVLCLDAHCEDPVPEEIIYHSHCDLLHKDGYKGKLKMLSSDLHLKWAEEHYKSNNENNFVAENIDDNNKLECENNNANAQKEKKNTLKDGNHKNENDDEDEEDVEEESDEETKSQKGRFCDTPYENDGVYYQFQRTVKKKTV